ncbi:MAG: alpha/beta fold hydrolase [Pseudomonadota bacterium]
MKRLLAGTAGFLLSLFFTTGLAHAETEELVPARALIKPSPYERFVVSPDGQNMVHTVRIADQTYLQFTDLSNMSLNDALNLGSVDLNDLRWIDGNTLLLVLDGTLLTLEAGSTEARSIATMLVGDNRRFRSLQHLRRSLNYWQLVDMLPALEDVVLLGATDIDRRTSLYRVNTLTGEMTLIIDDSDLDANYWYTDITGTPAMGLRFKDDGTQLHYIRDPETGKWIRHDKMHKDSQIKLDFDGTRYLAPRAEALMYGANARSLYIADNRDSDRYRIVEYDPIAGEIIRTVYEDEQYDVHTPGNPSRLFRGPNGDVTGLAYLRDRMTTVWLSEAGLALEQAIDAKVDEPYFYVIDVSEAQDVALVAAIDATGRERVYIYRAKTDDLILHTIDNEELDAYDLPETQTVHYAARDGHEIEAYLTLPETTGTSRPPLIVMPHGGPFARSVATENTHAQYFASRGYAVIDPNFRGSIGFGKDHLSQGFGELGGTMIDDIVDAVDWAIAKGYADSENVFIVGSSYGGYAALMSAIRYPEKFSGLVASASVTDLAAQIKSLKKKGSRFGYEFWQEVAGDSRKKALRAVSPLYQIDNLTVPHLLFHGARDRIVDVEQTERLEEALLDSGRDANVKILANTGHTFGQTSDHLYYLEETLEQLEKWRTTSASGGDR